MVLVRRQLMLGLKYNGGKYYSSVVIARPHQDLEKGNQTLCDKESYTRAKLKKSLNRRREKNEYY